MTEQMEQPRARRAVDSSNREARLAVAPTLEQFSAWRSVLATLSVRAERRSTQADRQAMLARCDAIEGEIAEARIGLLAELADAPQKVAGHSRVADVERALDAIEMELAKLRGKLST